MMYLILQEYFTNTNNLRQTASNSNIPVLYFHETIAFISNNKTRIKNFHSFQMEHLYESKYNLFVFKNHTPAINKQKR